MVRPIAANRAASYDDLRALPDDVVGEIVGGELHASPRPTVPHAAATSVLGEELGPPFKRGRGGPGGWVLLDEPEVHLGPDVIVPDLGGWRRTRMPEIPGTAYISLAPDWVCEALSPSTARLDRGPKLAVYTRERVPHIWFVDPVAQTLELLRLDGETYRLALTATAGDKVRAEPFDAIELDLGLLWAC